MLKGVWLGIGPQDRVVLWGGGLWQWLDPLTAIRAMALVQAQRSDVRLVFPGTRHPNPDVPSMPVLQEALDLAQELGLLDRSVFFGNWISYDDWPSVLLESDVALSLHLDSVETRLAFRSRILDYVWAGLPMVVTEGAATSELVARFGLGQVVGYEDPEQVARGLLALLETPRTDSAAAFGTAREALTWEKVAQPLIAFCRAPRRAPDKTSGACTTWIDNRGLSREHAAELQMKVDHLQALVHGYASGRFMRFMRWWHGLFSSLRDVLGRRG